MTSIVNFTPVASLGGGALIGLAATGLMATLGRIAGLTEILRGLVLGMVIARNLKAIQSRPVAATRAA